jgi:hypothetical protein
VRRAQKQPWELSTEERIERAGWFKGGEREWQALPLKEREDLAFAATGCEVAYPTWPAPVNCCHVTCQIRRGELPKIALLNHELRSQAENWWRFIGRESGRGERSPQGRKVLARLYRHYRKLARERGEYDLWKLGGVEIAVVGMLA